MSETKSRMMNAEWDVLVSTPESQRFLADLAAEARVEIAVGTTQDVDELFDEVEDYNQVIRRR